MLSINSIRQMTKTTMNADEMVRFFRENFDRYFSLVAQRLTELQVPPVFICKPEELLFVIDGSARLLKERETFVVEDLVDPLKGAANEPACYIPKGNGNIYGSFHFSTWALSEECKESHIGRRELVQILFAHELVHAAMMTRLTTPFPPPLVAAEWIGADLRYIHEAIALRVCATLPESIATPEDLARYMDHVARRASANLEGNAYRRYFDHFHDIDDVNLWHTLTEPEHNRIEALLAEGSAA